MIRVVSYLVRLLAPTFMSAVSLPAQNARHPATEVPLKMALAGKAPSHRNKDLSLGGVVDQSSHLLTLNRPGQRDRIMRYESCRSSQGVLMLSSSDHGELGAAKEPVLIGYHNPGSPTALRQGWRGEVCTFLLRDPGSYGPDRRRSVNLQGTFGRSRRQLRTMVQTFAELV